VPNPDIPETHEVLLDRARVLHPGESIPDDAPSRFKKDGAAPQANGHDGAAAAPAVAAKAAPAAAPATAAAAPRPAATSARLVTGTQGRVEKAGAPPARGTRTFAGELPIEFDQLVTELGAPRRRMRSPLMVVGLGLLSVGQGVLGALSAPMKEKIERAVSDRRAFNAQLATAANIFLNLILYPVACVVFAVAAGRAGFFTGGPARWIVLGLTVGCAEAAFRLRENMLHARPFGETPLRGALYGPLVWPLGKIVLMLAGPRGSESSVGFDGFSAGREHFDDKLERDRRYGSIYRLEDRDDAYVLRVEFPRRLPPSSLADELKLPPEMPDYEYELAMADGAFVVHGRVIDPTVRKLTAVAPAFPPEFTTRVALRDPVTGFRHRYQDKVLEVVLPKVVR
jgi:hypothetical protein